MSDIILASGKELAGNSEMLYGMFSLRHHIFHGRLGWSVKSENGMERDEFDDLNPVYMVAREGAKVEGCWRILPTTGPYMLKDTFPDLLRGEEAPQDPSIWEVSRFAITHCDYHDRGLGGIGSLTIDMFLKVVELAERNDVRSYVTVISASFERLLKKINMPMRRFGDGKAQRMGKVISVAVWIDVNDQLKDCFLKARDATRAYPVAA